MNIMAKEWTSIKTVNSVPAIKESKISRNDRMRSFDNLIHNTKPLSAIDMQKQSEKFYTQTRAEEDKLLAAFEEKKVKSKEAIKRALRIKKERAAEKHKNVKQNTKKVSNKSENVTRKETTEKPA